MSARMALRQVGYENRSFWRNPAAAFFTFLLPLIFLVLFNSIFGDSELTIDGRDLDDNTSLYKRAVAKGMWKFGLEPDDVATFLDGYGWEVLEHLGYNDLRGQYLAPTGRDLKLLKLERLVYAEKR